MVKSAISAFPVTQSDPKVNRPVRFTEDAARDDPTSRLRVARNGQPHNRKESQDAQRKL